MTLVKWKQLLCRSYSIYSLFVCLLNIHDLNCSDFLKNLAVASQRPLRVLGWYHSHPHITVWPSHVDVNTQSIYQTMDSGFFGLIFSCFNHDAQNLGHIDLTCFQSVTRTTAEGQEMSI
jgi:hypothetical protein